MHPSMNTPPDGIQSPLIASAPLTGGRNSTTTTNSNHHGTTSENINNGKANTLLVSGGESKPSSSSSPPKSQDFSTVSFVNNGNSVQQQTHESKSTENPNQSGGDAFLQWGQRKRSKRTVGDKFSGVRTMPPPPPPPGIGGRNGGCGGTKLHKTNTNGFSSKDASSSQRNRNLEDSRMMMMMSGGSNGGGSPPSKNHQEGVNRPISSRSTVGKRSEKTDAKKNPCSSSSFGGSIRKEKPIETHHQLDHHLTSPARGGATAADTETHNGKGGGEVVECPRIFIALSRKEKEDDFFTMKGTKLPHRPKKRSKAIDRTLQFCFPGMWLSELSRARYEVRERKSVKKQPRRRGLKGLDSMESDSD